MVMHSDWIDTRKEKDSSVNIKLINKCVFDSHLHVSVVTVRKNWMLIINGTEGKEWQAVIKMYNDMREKEGSNEREGERREEQEHITTMIGGMLTSCGHIK